MSKCEPCRRGAHAECFWPDSAQCDCNNAADGKIPKPEPANDAERLERLIVLCMTEVLPLVEPLLRKRFNESMRPRLTMPPDCFKVSGARLQELMRNAGGNYAQMVEFVSVDSDYLIPFHTLNVLINFGPDGADPSQKTPPRLADA